MQIGKKRRRGPLPTDFSRLANEYFGVSLETVAGAFLLLCLLPPLLGLAATWLRPELSALRERVGEL